MNHFRDAHCKDYMAKQLRCFAVPQAAQRKALRLFAIIKSL
jgi:hypothetical protein